MIIAYYFQCFDVFYWRAAIDEAKRPENNEIQRNQNLALATDVIVIDSSDSEDELDAMITDDMKVQKRNSNDNNNTMGEILVSVRTEPSNTFEN